MKTADASAIADFLSEGGQILRIQEPVLVTTQEVLDYLKSSGVARIGSGSAPNVYYCEGKRMNLIKIVDIANRHRGAEELPPFAIRA